jgi:hypothetical protein
MAQGQGPCGGLEQRHPHSESAVPRSGVRIAAAGFGRLFGCRFLRSARDFADVIARGNHEDSSESLPKSGRPLIACWISCASADGRDAKEVRTEGPSRCGNPCVGSIAIRPTPSVLRTGCSRVLVRASGPRFPLKRPRRMLGSCAVFVRARASLKPQWPSEGSGTRWRVPRQAIGVLPSCRPAPAGASALEDGSTPRESGAGGRLLV